MNESCNLVNNFNFQLEYRVKWLGYASSDNSWVREENARNCGDLIIDLENSLMNSIIGMKKNVVGQIEYAIEWKDGFEPEFKNSDIVRQRWPLELAEFLESRIKYRVIDQTSVAQYNVKESDVPDATPNRILKCSDTSGELLYWCEWEYNQRKFISSKKAKEQFVNLVIEYLEMNLQ